MEDKIITLAHGGGGLKTKQLVDDIIIRHLGNPELNRLDDSACIDVPQTGLAMTTDSYVITPYFFPGGDIGKLAVCGTVNDLCMQGAIPLYLSFGLILEEGFPVPDLERIVHSMALTLKETDTKIVTGDTKVVERRGGGGIFINTAGIGARRPGIDVHVKNARPGDAIMITGTLGDHSIAVMSRREGLGFETELESDVAPLSGMVGVLLDRAAPIHCLRDLTRGGLAAALCDIAGQSGAGITIEENMISIKKAVRSACGLLGLDPLNAANEGKAVVVCPAEAAQEALSALKSHPLGRDAAIIGEIRAGHPGQVVLRTGAGGERIVELPSGEDLPRIC
jgi:hydrogenase expression/formation protein HypE